ncbi:pantoate--beta-alanine ligase [Flavobacteriaceae bacterium]|jgi:pantoate--beta-alanine ligase|nr:pantoate--beta-alanine ligase [Flavobacteriaceae bacterium]MDB2328275.1 pantoate--beta-alanine ligase [Flavobacteriaceae bacterium]
MIVIHTARELRKQIQLKKTSVGLVPTMGALHTGHLSLVKRASEENHLVIVSIYVNPTQFNDKKDLENYPKNLDQDLELLQSSSENIILYAPENDDIYPDGMVPKNFDFGSLALQMEGFSRPGHFDGVATVVEALLKNTTPTRAYFGEKDFQQLTIIKELNKQLKLGVEIISCPIIREKNGLAMSSRNQLLSPKDREEAKVIFKSLEAILKHAEKWTPHQMKQFFIAEVENLKGFKVEYFSVASPSDLIPVDHIEQHKMYRIFVAVYAGKTRLIDTVELKRK